MRFVQHKLDKLESWYFSWTKLEDGSVRAEGALPAAIGQCGYGQVPLLRLLGRAAAPRREHGGLCSRAERVPALPRAATTTAGAAFPGTAPWPSSRVIVTRSPPCAGHCPGWRERAGYAPAGEQPARPRYPAFPPLRGWAYFGDKAMLNRLSLPGNVYCRDGTAVALSAPPRPRAARYTTPRGTERSPGAHRPGTCCCPPLLPSRRARGQPRRSVRGGQQEFVGPGGDMRRGTPPAPSLSAPTAREQSPQSGSGSYLRRRSGGTEPGRTEPGRAEANRAEPNSTEAKQIEPSRAVPRPLLAWREPPPRRYLGRPRGRSSAGRGRDPRGAREWESPQALRQPPRVGKTSRVRPKLALLVALSARAGILIGRAVNSEA